MSKKSIFNVLLPLFIGIIIYILFRDTSLDIFDYLNSIKLMPAVQSLRELIKIKPYDWIIYCLPDGLWAYSFTSLLLTTNNNLQTHKLYSLCLVLSIGLVLEVLQYFQLINGTFDIIDIFFFIFGSMLSILIFNKYV